ncbi:hypothetical protein [Lacinutrix sp. Hel_I_90]|uniref:hypothetical protein n=1 Tax=Lacinutrix sp. Hel_I_90 TaxID=1249999 RepID=UPI000A4C74F9|nr:hypothetical protein [Lacinutrix sp. Hel_I_90]
MKTKTSKLSFDTRSILELNTSTLNEVKGGTSLILGLTTSIQIPTINYSTNTLCTSDAK